MRSKWVKQLLSLTKLGSISPHIIHIPAQKIKNPLKLSALLILIAVITGLGAWQAHSSSSAVKASAADSSMSVSESTLTVSNGTASGASQDNAGTNVQQPGNLNVSTSNNPPAVNVNGQTFTPSKSGSLNKTLNTSSGNVDVSIQGNTSTNTSSSGHSFQNVFVHSNSDVDTNLVVNQQTSGAGH